MANYANAKATIAANVYQNNNNEVTANMVKAGINAVVDTLISGGYLNAGIAHPDDAAVTPDANVFYIASEAGTYVNKGGIVVADGEVAVLKYNGTWSKEAAVFLQKFEFVKDCPFIKELYINSAGIAAGCSNLNAFSTVGKYRISFNDGTNYVGRTPDGVTLIDDAQKVLPIISTTDGTTIIGYILVDWTQMPNPKPTNVPINFDIAKYLDFSPTIKSAVVTPVVQQISHAKNTAPSIDLFTYFLESLLSGKLEWANAYYAYADGAIVENSIYRSTKILPKEAEACISACEYVGSDTPNVYHRTHKSLWNAGVYVGYKFNGAYYAPDGTVTTEPEYDTFAINVHTVDIADYETRFKFISLGSVSESMNGKYQFPIPWVALGDSTTYGARSTDDHTGWADIVNQLCSFPSYTKLAVNSTTTMVSGVYPKLATQVANIPADFAGIVTIMIGVNDVGQSNPMGDADAVLAMNYADLDDTTTFAEAFRYNLETIKRNFPDAVVLVMLPLAVGTAAQWPEISEATVEPYREVERKICKALAVPFVEPAIQAGISAIFGSTFWDSFMADKVHPNSAGYAKIAHWMIGKMLEFAN